MKSFALSSLPGESYLKPALYCLLFSVALIGSLAVVEAHGLAYYQSKLLLRAQTDFTQFREISHTYRVVREKLLSEALSPGQKTTLEATFRLVQADLRQGSYAEASTLIQKSQQLVVAPIAVAASVPLKPVDVPVQPESSPKPSIHAVASQPTPKPKLSVAVPSPAVSPAQPKSVQATPTPQPTAQATPPVSGQTLTEEGILYWTNVERQNNNLAPLKNNSKLNLAAGNRVSDMFAKQYFSHTAPNGDTYVNFINAVGYTWHSIAENIAEGTAGYYSDKDVVDMWMKSEGHRKNLLNPVFTEIGIGVGVDKYLSENSWFAVQLFGTP